MRFSLSGIFRMRLLFLTIFCYSFLNPFHLHHNDTQHIITSYIYIYIYDDDLHNNFYNPYKNSLYPHTPFSTPNQNQGAIWQWTIEWDLIPTDPVQVSCDRSLLGYSGFFGVRSGTVRPLEISWNLTSPISIVTASEVRHINVSRPSRR